MTEHSEDERVTAFLAGFHTALCSIELYDAECVRLGRTLTDAELRQCAEFWIHPVRFVTYDG